jgi:hypothetical protein
MAKMAAIKPLDTSAAKYTSRASIAGPAYAAGIANPRTPWAAASAAANSNYVAGVTQAANAGRYSSGVRAAGDAKWAGNATAKGPQRYAEGVQLAQGLWATGFQRYHAAIGSLNLPARGPSGSPANLQRVQAVTSALHALKLSAGK